MKAKPVPIGTVFGRLTVISEPIYIKNKTNSNKTRFFECLCLCDNTKTVRYGDLNSGDIKSCGCLHKEAVSKQFTTHGLSKHPLYKIHKGMHDRCYLLSCKSYKDYGGRGIKICSEWRAKEGFIEFFKWAVKNGYRKGLEIDRKNNDKGYKPSNCRFVKKKLNLNNKSNNKIITHENKDYTFTEFVEKFGKHNIDYKTAWIRYKRGWSAMDAVTKKGRLK